MKANTNTGTEKVREFNRYNFNNIPMTPEVVAMINAGVVFLEPTKTDTWTIADQIEARTRCQQNCENDMSDLQNADAGLETLRAWRKSHIETIEVLMKLKDQF